MPKSRSLVIPNKRQAKNPKQNYKDSYYQAHFLMYDCLTIL